MHTELPNEKRELRLAYLIPEFPGQTHIWMWREILHLREWGWNVALFSTRPPRPDCAARHGWAPDAARATFYIAGRKGLATAASMLAATLWAVLTRPRGLVNCLRLAYRLPIDACPSWRVLLPLVPAACRLAMGVRRAGVQHLHCHTCANGAVLAMMNRRLTGVPFSMTLNANLEWWGGAMLEKMQDAAFTIAITEWLLEQIRRDFPQLPPEKALLGRIGVDTRKWIPSERTAYEPARAFRLVSVGRLKVGKGHCETIQAVARLRKQGLLVELRILGDGPDRHVLDELICSLGVQQSVTLVGSVSEDDVISELKQADAFVLPSHTEPLGVVYMEAMALGVPTIGTTDGGACEIIRSGEDGLLVPPCDIVALCHAIEHLVENPAGAKEMGAKGRQRIVRSFDSRLGAEVLHERILQRRPVQASASAKMALVVP